MVVNNPNNMGASGDAWSVTLTSPGGDNITSSLTYVDRIGIYATSASINYGSQIGACFIMLVVLLAMTPKTRFKRATTIVHILGLTINMIRMVLLAYYFTSSWFTMSVYLAGDLSSVRAIDYNNSVAAIILTIPVVLCIETALSLQAWSMVQLWPRFWKITTTILSVGIVLTTIAFSFTNAITQAQYTLRGQPALDALWIPKTYLALIATSITWFTFLFISRLLMHMYTNRSILPSMQGLNAMDVLVITNGILMLVPVVFAGLEFAEFYNFESATLTQTSVIVVLPLGTLVAQRLANPGWFATPSGSTNPTHGMSATGGTRPQSKAAKRGLLSATTTSNTSRSNNSPQEDAFAFPVGARGLNGSVSSEVRGGYSEKAKFRGDNVDSELARIDSEGVAEERVEHGREPDLERGVRVDRVIDMSVERKGSPDRSS